MKKSKIIFYVFLVFISLIIFGCFSYIRNYILTNNPLYPLDFRIFDKIIFKGVMYASTYKAHWSNQDYNLAKLFFHEGMGLQFLLLFIPGIFLALPLALLKDRKKIKFDLIYFLILPFLLYFAFRYIIPQLWTRFLYPFLGVSAIVSFYSIQRLNLNKKFVYLIVTICILASLPELARRLQLIFALLLTCIFYLAIPFCIKVYSRRKIAVNFLLVALILSLILIKFVWVKYEKEEYPRYFTQSRFWPEATLAWKWLNENTSANKIAYVGRPVPFPLYGTNFKNEVYYVSVNDRPPQLHAYKEGHLDWSADFHSIHRVLEQPGNYRANPNYALWYKNLKNKNTDYLFVYVLHETKDFPIEDTWARSRPEDFKLVFFNSGVHIYKLIK